MLITGTILLASHYPVVRKGLTGYLREITYGSINSAGSHTDSLQFAALYAPELIILDQDIPCGNGPTMIPELLHHSPNSKILVIASKPNDCLSKFYLKNGAKGYISLRTGDKDFKKAILAVLKGRVYIDGIVKEDLSCFNKTHYQRANGALGMLTLRELEVMRFLAEGKGTKEIREILGLKGSTVSSHKAHILKKLDLHNQVQIAEYYQKYRHQIAWNDQEANHHCEAVM